MPKKKKSLKQLESNRKYMKKNWKRMKDIEMYSGNKAFILERDNYKCTICGSKKLIQVHHIDGKGKGYKKFERNDSLENLITVCHSCHRGLHRKYDENCTIDNCDKKHFSRGMCRPHYMKWYKGVL